MAIDYIEIGERIAKRRRALGLKQREAAERADITDNYLSNIERAVSIPSLDVLMRLCDALETTPDALLLGTSLYGREEQWQSICEQVRGLAPRQRELVRSFLLWVQEQEL